MPRVDQLIELMIKLGMDSDPEKLQFLINESKKLTVTMFALYILKEAKEHEDCDPSDCNVIKHIPTAMENFIKEISDDIREHVEMNLTVNGFPYGASATHNEQIRDAILKELKDNSS